MQFRLESLRTQPSVTVLPDVAQDPTEVELELQSLGELRRGVSQHADLASCSLVTSPGLHHEGIIDGDADDLINSACLQTLGSRHVA